MKTSASRNRTRSILVYVLLALSSLSLPYAGSSQQSSPPVLPDIPKQQANVNPAQSQTPKTVDEIVNQYVSLYASEVGDPLKACGAAATWSESVTYDGTQELYTIKGEFHFVPDRLRALWKMFVVDASMVAGGWERQDIREKDPTIAMAAGLTLSATSDIVVRPFTPGTAKVTYSLIQESPRLIYKFTLDYDVTIGNENVHNSQVVYVIIGWTSPPWNMMWVLAPPPTYGADIQTFGAVAVPAYPFYVEFELRSTKQPWQTIPLPSMFETARTEFSSRTVTTGTHFLLKWGSAWGGGLPPQYGIPDYAYDPNLVYKDEVWRVEKSTQVKLSNPPNPPTQGIPSGPNAYVSASAGVKAAFRVSTTEPDGHHLVYWMDCNGDGKIDQDESTLNSFDYQTPVTSGQMATVWGLWKTAGTYAARIVVLDEFGGEAWSSPFTVHVANTSTSTTKITSTVTTTATSTTTGTVTRAFVFTQTVPGTTTRTVITTVTTYVAPRTITRTSTLYTSTWTWTETRWSYSMLTVLQTSTQLTLTASSSTVTTSTGGGSVNELHLVTEYWLMRITNGISVQVSSFAQLVVNILTGPVVQVEIIEDRGRHYMPPPETREPTLLDTLTEKAPIIAALAAVSIVAVGIFVMRRRRLSSSMVRQWLTIRQKIITKSF